jgi:hypothetical protein
MRGLERYIDQPHEVSIETLTFCNAACTFCPYPTLERKGEKMPDALLDKLIDEMATFEMPFYFSPFKVNEPLLDKRWHDICQKALAANDKLILRIFSNGSTLTQRNIEKIADLPRVAHLWISLNEHRPDEYKKLMGLDFEKTAKKIDRLHEMDFPHRVVLSSVGFPNEDFRRYCWERWNRFESLVIKNGGWLGFADAHDTEVPDTDCARWWELSIMSNGKASLCCMDGEGEYGFGDTNDETLLEIYAKTRHWRDGKTRLDVGDPCNRCTN